MGKSEDAAKYAARAGNFVKLWNPNTTVPDNSSIVGMMQVRASLFERRDLGLTS